MIDKYPNSQFIEVYGTNYHIVDIDEAEENYFYKATVYNVIVDDGSFNYVDGDAPLSTNDIAVTDYFIESYNFYKDEDIGIGDYISINGVKFKICGVVQTSYNNYKGNDQTDLFRNMAFQENLEYYNAFYLSALGQDRWWKEMTYFEEYVKYNKVTTAEIKNATVIFRKETNKYSPGVITGNREISPRQGIVSRELWTDLLGMSITDSLANSYSISFICTNRTKYTLSFRSVGVYNSHATTFENPNDYEVILYEDTFKKFLNDNAGIGVVELVLILVVLIALVVVFKGQITKIVGDAFNSITSNANSIIK